MDALLKVDFLSSSQLEPPAASSIAVLFGLNAAVLCKIWHWKCIHFIGIKLI